MNKKIIILGTIATGTIIAATVVPIVLLNNNEEKIEKDNVIYANKLKALKTKIITIGSTSGDVTINKNAIINKIKSLNNFPKLPKGITLDVKDSSQKLTTSGVPIILIVKKEGETNIEIKDFKVKIVQSYQEIVDNYATKLKALKIKEVTIDATSGTINEKKNDIIEKIKALDDFPTLPNGVILDVEESPIEISILGVAINLLIKKGNIIKELIGFRVKRNKSNQEIVDNYATKLNALKIKEVTIDAISGTITEKKNDIIEKIKALGDFPRLPNGVTLDVKESVIKISISGVAINLLIKKGNITKELLGFIVKRSKSNQEVVDNYKNDLLARINQKDRTIKIDATSGTITSKKVDIINKIEKINGFVAKPTGVILEVKDDPTQITLEGTLITLVIKKDLAKIEIATSENFKVKRSKSNQEIVDNYKTNLLAAITQKDRTIKIDATSGTITSKKANIINKIEKIKGFVAKPTGVSLEVKDDPTQITTEGILITLVIKKDSTKIEIGTSENFKVKRSKSNQEVVDNYKTNLLAAISQKDRTIKIDATSGTITSKKVDIINKIEKIEGFIAKPAGVIFEVKDDPTEISLEGTLIILVIKKDSAKTEIGVSEEFKVKRSLSSQEIVNDYASKLSSISKEIIVPISSSGTIIEKKNDILNAIKGLPNFPELPNDLILDIKDSTLELTTTSVEVILIIKKDGVNDKEVSGFTVKRVQDDQESIDIYKSLLLNSIKAENRIVKIDATSGTVTDKKNDIIKKIEKTKGFISKPEGVSLEVEDDPTNITPQGIAITLVIKKGSTETKIVSNIADPFKVKRNKTLSELAVESVNNVRRILDEKSSKIVTIINFQAKVGAIGVANKIKAKVEQQIGSENLDGVIVSISADNTNADIIDTGTGVGFKITLSKVDASPVEITDWKVKREKTQNEKDVDSIKAIFDEQSSKIVTIVNLQAKVDAPGVSAKIVEALKVKINQDDLKDVKINVKPNPLNEDIIDNGNGIGFIITLSKGDAPLVEIINWKIKREKTNDEKDIDEVKAIFDGVILASKIVKITNIQAKVDAPGVSAKIVKALKAKINENNLKGIKIIVKPNTTNADILNTGQGTGFIITLSKGSAQLAEITNWKVKLKTDEEIVDDYVAKLNALSTKEVEINFSGTITENKIRILDEFKYGDFPSVVHGIILEIENSDLTPTTSGVEIAFIVKKGSVIKRVTGFIVKKAKTNQEIVDDYFAKLNALPTKQITLFEVLDGTITKHKELIRSAIVDLTNFPLSYYDDGLTLKVKKETTALTTSGVEITLVLKKDEVEKEISGFSVKLKVRNLSNLENKIKSYYSYTARPYRIEFYNSEDDVDNKSEIQNSIKSRISDDFKISSNNIIISSNVNDLSFDEDYPSLIVITFNDNNVRIKREFKISIYDDE